MAIVAERSLNGIGYRVLGEGQNAIVLLRGLARWSDHWLGFDEALAARGLKVITIDNRGFGRSSAASIDELTVSFMAEDVAGVITKEAPSGAHILGVSLGGMIAISLAAFKPQLVRSLVIINSSVGSSGLRRLSGRAILTLLVLLSRSKKGHMKLADVLLGDKTVAERRLEFAQRWQAIDSISTISMKSLLAQLMAAKKFNGQSELAAIRCPVRVVKGNADRFVDPSNSDFIHKSIRGSELIVHADAGHELVFDDPDWILAKISEHIQSSTHSS